MGRSHPSCTSSGEPPESRLPHRNTCRFDSPVPLWTEPVFLEAFGLSSSQRNLRSYSARNHAWGVKTNSNLPGIVARKALVSLDVCAEWLSSTSRILSPLGYLLSRIFRNSMKSELLWVSLTSGIASPVTRSRPARSDCVPWRTYS